MSQQTKATSVEEKLFRVRRESDGMLLARDGATWTADVESAWQTDYPPAAAEAAFAAQDAAGHSFFAAVVPA